jgi:hypothetical protein
LGAFRSWTAETWACENVSVHPCQDAIVSAAASTIAVTRRANSLQHDTEWWCNERCKSAKLGMDNDDPLGRHMRR